MSTTDELLEEMLEDVEEYATPVTDDDLQFWIDEHLRVISIPKNGVVAGVEGDKNVNKIKFGMNRYYHGFDMSTFSGRILYSNAKGNKNYYNITDMQASGSAITFSWLVDADAVQYMGKTAFVVYLFKIQGSELRQKFYSTLATLKVLEGMEVDSAVPVEKQTDIIERMKEEISAYAEEVKKSLPADYTAMTEQVSSLKEDLEYFKDDVTKAFNVTENLYNPHSFTNTKGIALTIADGTEYADSTTVNAITTGYFDTNEGDVWRFYRWNTAKDNIYELEVRVHWFDENGKYISGAIITGDVTAPINARRLRFTEKFTLLYPTLDVMVTKNYSFGVNGYVPYGITQLKETFLPREKVYEQVHRNGTLHSGDSWVLENNNIMARKVFVLSGIVNSFSVLEMGHGTKTNSPSSWIVVDSTNITVYSTPTDKVILAHGLSIVNTIQIIIEVAANYKAKITLASNGEKYNTEQDWDGNIGNIFVNSINTELANCAVSWTCKNYSSPIWAYGDSYFGMTNKARWIAQLLSNGYGTDMLIDGYPGRGSNDAYNSLQATLKHGKPKYILWAMGMNDPDNESSVNGNWNNRFNDVKNVCKENDITLIGCTIPNTPTQFNSYKNNVVRNAGIKYIDFAKAVDAEHKGDSWYGGMLSGDNVHSTEKGSITLYLQALADFPELANT
jgi:hypothetical protein